MVQVLLVDELSLWVFAAVLVCAGLWLVGEFHTKCVFKDYPRSSPEDWVVEGGATILIGLMMTVGWVLLGGTAYLFLRGAYLWAAGLGWTAWRWALIGLEVFLVAGLAALVRWRRRGYACHYPSWWWKARAPRQCPAGLDGNDANP